MAKKSAKTSTRALATTTRRAAAPATLDLEAGTYAIRFGVILNINGKPVPVVSGDLSDAKKSGVEFTLQDPLDLGSLDDFRKWVSTKFGVSIPDAKDLPPPLNAVVGVITGMEISIEKAHVKVPGSDSKDPVAATLEVNGTFKPEIPLIDGKLGIQGLVFGFSNEVEKS